MRRGLGIWVVGYVCLLWTQSAFAQAAMPEFRLSVYRDPESQLTIADVRSLLASGAFVAVDGDVADFGQMSGTVWVLVELEGLNPDTDYILELASPRLTYVDFYDPPTASPLMSGAGYPFAVRFVSWLMPAFPISADGSASRTVILRIEETGVVHVPFRLWTWQPFGRYATSYVWTRAATAGAMFLLFCSNLGIFLVLRERGHLGIALYLAMFFLFYAAHQGLGPFALWPNWPWLASRASSLFGTLSLIAAMGLLHTLLNLKRAHVWLGRISYAWTAVLGFVALLVMTTDSTWRLAAVGWATLLTPTVAAALGVTALVITPKRSELVLRVYTGALLCCFVFALSYLGFLPASWSAVQLMAMVIVLACLVWTLDVAHRLKAREAESRERLAMLVEERSAKLNTALQEVEVLEKLLPICSSCKRIRDEDGNWQPVEKYLSRSVSGNLSHGICPDCMEKLYPEYQ